MLNITNKIDCCRCNATEIVNAEWALPWPLDILGNENKLYFQGYLVALTSIPSVKFTYESDTEFEVTRTCNFEGTDLKALKSDVKKAIYKYQEKQKADDMFKTIDDYFCKTGRNKVIGYE